MQETIITTPAAAPLGHAPGRTLLKVPSGQYAGRLLALMQTAPGQIEYTYADRPYCSWASPVTVAVGAADQPFDAVMNAAGDVQIAYTDSTSGFLTTRRLAFVGGTWSVLTPVTVFDGAGGCAPSLAVDADGTLYLGYTRIDGSIRTLYVKTSVDGGSVWGSGSSDAGDALTAGASSVIGKLVPGTGALHVVYCNGGLQLSHRSCAYGSSSWAAEFQLAAGSNFDEHFDVAASSDGRLGVVWDNGQLKYRDFDGDTWSPAVTLDADGGEWPQLLFIGTVPAIVYLSQLAAGQALVKYTTRLTGSFSAPDVLEPRAALLDSVVLYDAASATLLDLTAAAGDAATADVFHTASGALVAAAGDAVYLGMDRRFRFVRWLLSTAGAGGAVVYSYWNGSAWIAFEPVDGGYALDNVDAGVILWEDYNAVPQDWQKRVVDGASRFWVRVEAVSEFTTAPVGSRITAVSDLQALSMRR